MNRNLGFSQGSLNRRGVSYDPQSVGLRMQLASEHFAPWEISTESNYFN